MRDDNILEILSDKKVLCADDDAGLLKNIIEILEMYFEEVVGVNDGIKALNEANENFYDVLIFDISMPHIDGLEVIKNIRKKNKKIPILVLSAHTEQEYLWRAVDLKITKYLTKPFDRKTFFDALLEVALELVDYNLNIKLDDSIVYNYCTKQIENQNKIEQLSKNESRLLEYLYNKKNQIVSFDEILDYIWEYDKPSKEAIKAIVKELRKKIGTNKIKNVYGLGYKLEI